MRAMTYAIAALCLLTSSAAAGPLGVHRRAIVDGHAATGPAAATGALLATADDGRGREGAFMCSAVLVAPTVALTAAHCVALVEADAVDEGWQLDWWLSFADDVRGVEGPAPTLPPLTVAVEVVVHPGFDADAGVRSDRLDAAHDIAVLHLAAPAPVAPVAMARPGERAGLVAGAEVVIGGYGLQAYDDAATPGVRRAGRSRLIEVGPRELRVGRRGAADEVAPAGLAEKCGGDSGGPTFAELGGEWRVVGLTSRAHAADRGCDIAGIDTRVDAYAAWVDATAAAEPVAGCAVGGRGAPGVSGWALLLMLGWAWRRLGRVA